MNELISCTQCRGTMVLEDRGEMLDLVDVMTLFGYRCLACGHVEPSVIGLQLEEYSKLVTDRLEVQRAM
ncbi:MAG: hypothetical protein O2999_10405 [Nitrospirae bacterium]|nr:hypothetical protein [Nitrospirota bacterium]MDA1304695.1 hypothetical protein [Nitrospirota bacterium]